MNSLEYIKFAQSGLGENQQDRFLVTIVTNFTDDILKKIFQGVCNFYSLPAEVTSVPYKQYAFDLKNRQSQLWQRPCKITYFFFEANFFVPSEFTEDPEFFSALIEDIKVYAQENLGTVVISTFLPPFFGPLNNLVKQQSLFRNLDIYNSRLYALAEEFTNIEIFDVNRMIHLLNDKDIRDMRSLYAFDIPFTNDFFVVLAEQWSVYIRALSGKIKKCIVLDLDNTLWGGVVGEVGQDGIDLGPVYPGSAFLNFQRALVYYHNQGILLALNSKNNVTDVDEVFLKHPHMLLKKTHFSSIKVNWQDKVQNLLEISDELNIGLDSMIFFDDDAVNRELVKTRLPEVFVPDFSLPPEQYSALLYSLPLFNPFKANLEDQNRNQLYQQDRKRQELKTQLGSFEDFIAGLEIELEIMLNNPAQITRLSQLSQKTNQFNLTTKRYTEKEIESFMSKGLVFSASVSDKFGQYGVTILAILVTEDQVMRLDTFLMSCRIMGRAVEYKFLDFILNFLKIKGLKQLFAEFVSTPKNSPAENFLEHMGFDRLSSNSPSTKLFRKDFTNNLVEVNQRAEHLIKIISKF